MSLFTALGDIVPRTDLLLDKCDKAYAKLDSSTNVDEQWPLAVVRVNSTKQLVDVVRTCLLHNTPIVMRGAGSGKSGGAVGDGNSVIIDITRLNRIISIDRGNLLAEVEPGVVLATLKSAAQQAGLYYPPDPASSAICTIGGNVAENASGPSTLKYGTTRDYFLGGQAIIGTGDIINFGKRCPKGVSGFDIAALLCGSEGTLAVFTKIILRLLPLPKSQTAAIFFFSDETLALQAVNAILCDGHLPKTLEYVDQICLKALSKFDKFSIASARAALIIECDASFYDGAAQQLSAIHELLKKFALLNVKIAQNEEERHELWRRRSHLSEACTHYLGQKLSEDIAVPLGKITALQAGLRQLANSSKILCGIFGHAGDGNLHVQIMFVDDDLRIEAQRLRHEILLLVLSLGGTLSAEHGIGLQKKAYLSLEQSKELIQLQKRVKQAFDPFYLLNPGKIFD